VYAGKILREAYVPAYNRIARLATFLRVSPTVFDAYVQQYAQRAVGDNHWWENETVDADPVVLEIFESSPNSRPARRSTSSG